MWQDEEKSSGGRINHKRFQLISEADPETLAAGCPFCMTMMEDTLKARSLEEQMRVRDLAELVADATGAVVK
jgi:Fe-S oxidoreductase